MCSGTSNYTLTDFYHLRQTTAKIAFRYRKQINYLTTLIGFIYFLLFIDQQKAHPTAHDSSLWYDNDTALDVAVYDCQIHLWLIIGKLKKYIIKGCPYYAFITVDDK